MCLRGTARAVRGRAHEHDGHDGHDGRAGPDGHDSAVDEPDGDHLTGTVAAGATISRRAVIGAGVSVAAAATLLPALPAEARRIPFRRALDLSHVFGPDIPTFGAEKPHREVISGPFPPGTFGFYDQRWRFTEHHGTHMDAPGHVIGGGRLTPDIEPEELLVPAVVVDITRKTADDPNAVVTVDDVVAFERRHGRIPTGAAVLMHSGWASRWSQGDLAYRGTSSLDEFPYNFPGFDPEACDFLVRRRDIVGVGVDTLSTDPGESTDFPVHEVLGRADRWGLENLANLDRMPPRGATLVVGLVPWEASSGGPCRAMAIW